MTEAPAPRRLLVAITGASGAVYGLRLLQVLGATPGLQVHAVVSDAGWLTLPLIGQMAFMFSGAWDAHNDVLPRWLQFWPMQIHYHWPCLHPSRCLPVQFADPGTNQQGRV